MQIWTILKLRKRAAAKKAKSLNQQKKFERDNRSQKQYKTKLEKYSK